MRVILTGAFWGKVMLITLCSCGPLFAYKIVSLRFSPPSHTKLR